MSNSSDDYFDKIYADTNDPWSYETRWYEQRKRDICLSVLLKPKYQNAIELGCSNGVFSEALAQRCEKLLCIDGNQKAVTLAQQRLQVFPHTRVERRMIPAELPERTFDLIVISEILYYLTLDDIKQLLAWLSSALCENGTLLCCHWRYPIEEFTLNGEMVHQTLRQHVRFTHYVQLNDPDFLLDVWQSNPLSLAKAEGLV